MSHDRDHDRPPPAPILPPREPEPLGSKPKPDRERREHPVPTEPVDPRTHPNRRMTRVPLQAHPA